MLYIFHEQRNKNFPKYTKLFLGFFNLLEINDKEMINQNLSSELWDELFLEITDEHRPKLYDIMIFLRGEAFETEPKKILCIPDLVSRCF